MIASGYFIGSSGMSLQMNYWQIPQELTQMLSNRNNNSGLIVIAPYSNGQLGVASVVNSHLRPSDIPKGSRILGNVQFVVSKLNDYPALTSVELVSQLPATQVNQTLASVARLHQATKEVHL